MDIYEGLLDVKFYWGIFGYFEEFQVNNHVTKFYEDLINVLQKKVFKSNKGWNEKKILMEFTKFLSKP